MSLPVQNERFWSSRKVKAEPLKNDGKKSKFCTYLTQIPNDCTFNQKYFIVFFIEEMMFDNQIDILRKGMHLDANKHEQLGNLIH